MSPNFQMSRPTQLMAITERAVRETRGGVIAFADRVAEQYLERVPADQRRAKIKPVVGDIAQMSAAQRANRQTVDRYIKGDVKAFPSDLEEAWVRALPEQFQAEALRELSARYGLLPARLHVDQAPIASLGDVTARVGELLTRTAPIVSDNKIDAADRPYIKPALAAIVELQAQLASLEAQLVAALPDAGATVHPLVRNA